MAMRTDRLTSDLFAPALAPVLLHGAADLDGFRRAARGLLARQVHPDEVIWRTANARAPKLLSSQERRQAATGAEIFSDAPAVKVPADFLPLCESVILHRDPDRFGLLYRIFWRLAHEPGLRHDALDADRVKAQHLAHAVQHDLHRMKTLVRFRTVHDDRFRACPQDGPLHLAWFDPAHHIVEAVAPFFARRFAQMRWAIFTPGCSVEWDCVCGDGLSARLSPARAGIGVATLPVQPRPAGMKGQLRFGPGAKKSDLPPPDAGEQAWLAYYRHTFNPARVKRAARQQEMPRQYWRNLPEAHPYCARGTFYSEPVPERVPASPVLAGPVARQRKPFMPQLAANR